MCSVPCSVFSVQCSVFSVQCAVCSDQCAVCGVQYSKCTLFGVQGFGQRLCSIMEVTISHLDKYCRRVTNNCSTARLDDPVVEDCLL